MRKARFTEHQIIAVIKSVEAGRTVKDVCREAGISEATYYNWRSRYGGMEASDIKKIKVLMKKQIITSLLLLYFPVLAVAGLDYNQVITMDEKTICTKQRLNELDVEMTVKYNWLKGLYGDKRKVDFANEQLIWIEQRAICKDNIKCLEKHYLKRIDELNRIYDGLPKPLMWNFLSPSPHIK